MTTLNVSLTDTLQTTLGQAGVWAYAVFFETVTDPVTGDPIVVPRWTDMVLDGVVQSSGNFQIALPQAQGLKVYYIVQSQDAASPADLKSIITQQSDINWGSASTNDYRYDSFEVTLQSEAADAGNLSSVNGFGLPMSIVVPYDNGTSGSVGYAISGAQVAQDIADIGTGVYTFNYTEGPLAGQFRMAVSPTEVVGDPQYVDPPFASTDWDGYIQSLEGPQAEDIILTGQFNGAADANGVWHNGGYFAYQLQWDATASQFWLAPLAQSTIQGYVAITPLALSQSIYSTLGDVAIYTSPTDAQPYSILQTGTVMNTGANNQWGKLLGEFLTGFTGGFYGRAGISANPDVSAPVNLAHNNNWDPSYAFGQNVVPPATAPAYQTYDPYSLIFYQHSNSYGSNYSDALMSEYSVGGPLLIVSQPGENQNVDNINMTIFDDSEQPSGYTTPVIYNYIAPPTGGYGTPDVPSTGNNVKFSLSSAVTDNAGIVLDPNAQVTLAIMDGTTGLPLQTLTIDAAAGGALGLWQQWTIAGSPGSYTIAPTSPAVDMGAGTLLINSFPTTENGVTWYQIGVGGKTYNMYVTTSGGAFVNTAFTGQAGQLAIDGLATITPGGSSTDQTVPTFSVNFAVGDTVTFDPAYIVANPEGVSGMTPGYAPVAGTVSGATFTALDNQVNPNTNTISTTYSSIAFGWTGLNPTATSGAGTSNKMNQWISQYTNKIDPLTIAHVTIHPVAGGTDITVDGTADVDGQWQTSPVLLANATYTVTMQEFLPTDTAYANALTPVSQALTLTVDAPCFRAGTLIATPAGPRPVESLRAGDRVCLALDDATAEVIWTGHRQVDCTRHPDPRKVWPIRIAAGALGDATPQRDLYLSPDHALYLDGVLIPARRLVNGTTITQVQVASVTYHHIELPAHDVLLAEGAAAESYLDTGDRTNFTNAPGATKLHPDFSIEVWEAEGRAPLVVAGPVLAAVRARLASVQPERAAGAKLRNLVG